MESAAKNNLGRPRADSGKLGPHPLSIRLTQRIEEGLEEIGRLRGDELDRSTLVRILLTEAIQSELARLTALQQRR